MWTDGRTDMTKLIVAFRNFVKAHIFFLCFEFSLSSLLYLTALSRFSAPLSKAVQVCNSLTTCVQVTSTYPPKEHSKDSWCLIIEECTDRQSEPHTMT